MCYSARIWQDYRHYVRTFGATMSIEQFVEVFWHRKADSKIKIAKGLEAAFKDAQTEGEQQIRLMIDERQAQEKTKLEQDVFAQRKRLADAERALQTKATKAAAESKRIAGDKIKRALARLADLGRTDLVDRDARIFPGYFVPVLISEHGRRVIKLMRYGCRPAGKPASYDVRYPGTYNARRDNLEGFWKSQFGHTHGVVVINAFFEHVSRHRAEGRELAPGEAEENLVLEFRPRPEQDMLIACLWSHWTAPGQPDLWSFAAITDTPPPEVAAAGHDRCVIPIRPENLDAWLNPDPSDLAAQYAILDDRARPYYEHRMAA